LIGGTLTAGCLTVGEVVASVIEDWLVKQQADEQRALEGD